MPQPPSPTTTNFFEYDGGTVTEVPCESCEACPDETLRSVLMVPLLTRVLWLRRGLRRGERGGVFSLSTDE